MTTTAYATVDKLASPSPGVQFQGAATQTMVRSDPKTLKPRRGPAEPGPART